MGGVRLRILDLTDEGRLYSTVFITTGGEILSFCYTKLGGSTPIAQQQQVKNLSHYSTTPMASTYLLSVTD